MGNTLNLIRKDWITVITGAGVATVGIFGAWVFVGLLAPRMVMFYSVILSYMLVLVLFTLEENQQVVNINVMLPVSKTQMVVSRYLYVCTATLFIGIGSSILIFISTLVTGSTVLSLPLALSSMSAALLMSALSLPVIYKVGANKARIYILLVYGVAIAFTTGLQNMFTFDSTSIDLTGTIEGGAFLIFGLSIVAFLISMGISRVCVLRRKG